MRTIKADPQPVLVDGNDRWLLPSTRPGVKGGLYFTYPCYRIGLDYFDDLIPASGSMFDPVAPEPGMELIQIEGIWYWIEA